MLKQLSIKMTNVAIKYSIISESERDIYEFAYLSLIERIISWGTILLLGSLFDCFLGSIIFLISFVPLRIYAGGFHSRAYWQCFITSSVTFLITLFFFKNIYSSIPYWLLLVLFFVSILVIVIKSPMADPNKPLCIQEIQKYKLKARKILLIEIMVTLPALTSDIRKPFPAFVVIAIILEALLLLFKAPKTNNILMN